jgi:hypothetical protein
MTEPVHDGLFLDIDQSLKVVAELPRTSFAPGVFERKTGLSSCPLMSVNVHASVKTTEVTLSFIEFADWDLSTTSCEEALCANA